MIFSHLVRASLSSIFRKYSINLLSFRLASIIEIFIALPPPPPPIPVTLPPAAADVEASCDDIDVTKPRGLEHISHTTLAEEFSYVHAGQCHVFIAAAAAAAEAPLLCLLLILVVLGKTAPVLCRYK